MGKTEFTCFRTLAEFVLCICAIKIGVSYSDDCDTTMTTTSITMKKWLIVRGAVGLAIIPFTLVLFICELSEKYKNVKIFTIIGLFIVVLTTLFACSWFIVGFVVLFHSNIECFNAREPMAIYMACDLIITLGLSMIYHTFFEKDKKSTDTENTKYNSIATNSRHNDSIAHTSPTVHTAYSVHAKYAKYATKATNFADDYDTDSSLL
jgi:hypothetical protein